MKKAISCSITLAIVITFLFVIIYCLFFMPTKYHIKTEYGDSFTVINLSDGLNDIYCLKDDNSDYYCELSDFCKKDFKHICDTNSFRCYQIENEEENIYIIKIKDIGSFDYICCNEESMETMRSRFKSSRGIELKSYFLCDEHLMEIIGPFLLDTYYDEMCAILDNLNNGDYEKLKEYGLTDEMIKDTESLKKKKAVMNQLNEYGHTVYELPAPDTVTNEESNALVYAFISFIQAKVGEEVA